MPESIYRVRPTLSNDYLPNPHRGCCTFQRFNGDPLFEGNTWSEEGPMEFPSAHRLVAEHYLPTTVSYCRWFWRVFEPEEDRYDFSVIDQALNTARDRGQTLAVRLMAHGSARQPPMPDWYGKNYPTQEMSHKSFKFKVPDYNSSGYLDRWGKVMGEFAKRYDGHPSLESVDMAYIGPWGEGHGECGEDQCRRFARLWKEAFKKTPRLALLSGVQAREGIASGAGWRVDCFGDLKKMGSVSVPCHLASNHMFDHYPRSVVMSGAADTWKTAPVHFETCGTPMDWYQNGYDIDFIIEQGLKYHATYFMPKSTALPAAWMEKLSEFCRRMGYRFVYRQALFDRKVSFRGKLKFQSWIENIGVAPLYRKYVFALRLRQGDIEKIIPLDHLDVCKWLPGDVCLDEEIEIPEGFSPGRVELAAGLLDRETGEARIHFAVKERFLNGWVDLQGFDLFN